MNKKNGMCWRDFFTGAATGMALALLICIFIVPSMIKSAVGNAPSGTATADSGTASETTNEPDLKMYVTDKSEWDITTADGTTLKFYTPSDWFSLADQYNDGLTEYYGKELPDDGIACVGNTKDQYDATMVINARPMSDVAVVLQAIYGEDYSEENMLYSDTYLYMKDGTEPEETTIEELESITAAGHTYRVFKHGYDTEYYTDETQTETTTVHTDEIISYSDTEDVVEIIMYMAEFDQDTAVSKLREFLGAE